MGVHLQQRQRKQLEGVEDKRMMDITRAVWSIDAHHREAGARVNSGQMFAEEYEEYFRAIAQNAGTSKAPSEAQRNAAATGACTFHVS